MTEIINSKPSDVAETPASMSRRSLVLGAPTTLALGAIGVASPSANSQIIVLPPPPPPFSISAFGHFYVIYFQEYSRTVMAQALADYYKMYIYPSSAITRDMLLADIITTRNVVKLLIEKGYALQVTNWVTHILTRPTDQYAYLVGPRPYDYDKLIATRDAVLRMTQAEINTFQQHQVIWWSHIWNFALITSTDAQVAPFAQQVVYAEAADDRRYLLGKAADGIEEVVDSNGNKTGELRASLNNGKAIVEREEAKNLDGLFTTVIFGPNFEPNTYEKHSEPTTKRQDITKVSKPAGVTVVSSTAFGFNSTQLTAIRHYVSMDHAKNKSYWPMTTAMSRRVMETSMRALERGTGEVYSSYPPVHNGLRAMNQFVICGVRVQLVGGYINLDHFQSSFIAQSLTDPSYRAMWATNQYNFEYSLMLLSTMFIGGTVAGCIGLYCAREAVRLSVDSDDPEEIIIQDALYSFAKWTAGPSALIAGGAIGIYAGTAISADDATKTWCKTWLGPAFAVNDIYGGMTDIVRVFKGEQDHTLAGQSIITSATVRISMGLVGMADFIMKYFHIGWSTGLGSQKYPAGVYGVLGAGVGGCLLMFSSVVQEAAAQAGRRSRLQKAD